ncbi:LysR family transcriptional regulator [Mesorhizobium sp. M2A.F.Ca.ET.067.02.1.1]|uniref:LysR family transcriptional regulator n=1 Tax=Mesorhizobium sp. M2A.F.Ca.ET.067.02.1.1 TaxID=2496749 RepID=UPI000FD436EE|nr:LysR family transcriptional regulator [Mesorhizobium sp. M2A.F.Ca.ET.067.02.1.1]RUW81281.1 LysR family transcriptional regulator [Mesorhizobium sp. M2A.F.Ca.ET.067.02.1.1]TIU59187.1 MAG: LysR family transcriptional regulator [Mesorhizobium sp.]
MDDLNELTMFASVARHGSFSSAALALGIPKSRVSRRIAALEARLGVRLLQRSTRSVNLTSVGQEFLKHCNEMIDAARLAFEIAEQAGEAPAGRLRVSCPVGLAHVFVAPVLWKFMRAHPAVRLDLDLTNRRVDLIAEGYDIALRVRSTIEDSQLMIRRLGISEQWLVAGPEFVSSHGPFDAPQSLHLQKGLGPAGVRGERNLWRLTAPDGQATDIEYVPALATDDIHMLGQAALAGMGIAQLPRNLCGDAVRKGRLVRLLPDHTLPPHQLHAVFPSRRGLVPAVRTFLDFLGHELPQLTAKIEDGYATGSRDGGLLTL